jgi:nitrogen-specific signal transduction histidine kinase
MVMADPVEIHQIFMNLCTNAAYAMKKSGGFLVVRLEDIIIDENFSVFHGMITPGAYIRIAITDTGDGIPPDAMDLIFEPYYTTKPLGEGTGLGLYVTHSIVKECRGTITVNSEKGKGSCFEIYFPIIKDIKEKTDEEEKKVPVQIGNERILFVDDELQLVKLGRRRLESLGYQISGRTNSIETLQAFKAMPAL